MVIHPLPPAQSYSKYFICNYSPSDMRRRVSNCLTNWWAFLFLFVDLRNSICGYQQQISHRLMEVKRNAAISSDLLTLTSFTRSRSICHRHHLDNFRLPLSRRRLPPHQDQCFKNLPFKKFRPIFDLEI